MKTHRLHFPRVLALTAGLALLPAGIRNGGAGEQPAAARQVAAKWNHPEAMASSGSTGAGNGSIAGLTFRVPRPFKEVWEFYAKKCGYTNPFPGPGEAMSLSGGSSCIMMYENSTLSGGGVSAAFSYREDGNTVGVTLVDRKDGVRVFVSVGAR